MSNPPPANQEGNASNMQAVAAVGVKLPDFWKTDPEMWFAQAEAQFTLANITRDDTKYSHIVAKVDQTVICHIADLVHRPPLENKYIAVKESLIGRFPCPLKPDWKDCLERTTLEICVPPTFSQRCRNSRRDWELSPRCCGCSFCRNCQRTSEESSRFATSR